jgi:hypothetical protein
MGGLVAFSTGSGSNAAINHKNRLPAVYNAVEQISNDIVKKYRFPLTKNGNNRESNPIIQQQASFLSPTA